MREGKKMEVSVVVRAAGSAGVFFSVSEEEESSSVGSGRVAGMVLTGGRVKVRVYAELDGLKMDETGSPARAMG